MINKLTTEMIKYYKGDPKRINHFLKVFSYSKFIGMNENLDEKTQFTLETTALVHDIGIKISEEKYNSSSGKYQEIEGPAIAKEMLENLGYDRDIIERVCYLVGHHHTYNFINGIDYQILVEADFLVNLYEDKIYEDKYSQSAVESVYNKIFKTETGKEYFRNLFMWGVILWIIKLY